MVPPEIPCLSTPPGKRLAETSAHPRRHAHSATRTTIPAPIFVARQPHPHDMLTQAFDKAHGLRPARMFAHTDHAHAAGHVPASGGGETAEDTQAEIHLLDAADDNAHVASLAQAVDFGGSEAPCNERCGSNHRAHDHRVATPEHEALARNLRTCTSACPSFRASHHVQPIREYLDSSLGTGNTDLFIARGAKHRHTRLVLGHLC